MGANMVANSSNVVGKHRSPTVALLALLGCSCSVEFHEFSTNDEHISDRAINRFLSSVPSKCCWELQNGAERSLFARGGRWQSDGGAGNSFGSGDNNDDDDDAAGVGGVLIAPPSFVLLLKLLLNAELLDSDEPVSQQLDPAPKRYLAVHDKFDFGETGIVALWCKVSRDTEDGLLRSDRLSQSFA